MTIRFTSEGGYYDDAAPKAQEPITTISSLRPGDSRAVRRAYGRPCNGWSIRIDGTDDAPALAGDGYYWTTPSGKTIVSHPNAYGWPTWYHGSTRHLVVGDGWLTRLRAIVAGRNVQWDALVSGDAVGVVRVIAGRKIVVRYGSDLERAGVAIRLRHPATGELYWEHGADVAQCRAEWQHKAEVVAKAKMDRAALLASGRDLR